MAQVLAILSGKGGTGKTSVCAGLCVAMAAEGKRVLAIDCDVGLRNLDISLGMAECGALSFLDISEGGYALSQAAVHPELETLRFLTAPMNRSPEKIDPMAFQTMIQSARREFDYIFLDAPAGVDAGFRLAAQSADRCILVTGPGPAAVRDAARVGDILDLMGKTDVRLVVNRVEKTMLKALHLNIDDVMDTAGLPLIGVVLEDPNVTLAAAFGKSLRAYAKRSPAAKAFLNIAQRIQGNPRPMVR